MPTKVLDFVLEWLPTWSLAAVAGYAFGLLLVTGCAVKAGPLEWDVCGFEGGVDAEISFMDASARLGCFEQQQREETPHAPSQ